MRYEDITGQTFGKWTVIADAGRNTSRQTMWLCRCQCGVERTISGSNLKMGRSKGCTKCRDNSSRTYEYVTGNGPAARLAFRHYEARSRKYGIRLEISFELFLELSQQPCYYCGEVGSNYMKPQTKKSDGFRYNGLDRFEPELGYVVGNVVACCKYCNRMKSDMSYIDFVDRVALIAQNHNRENLGLTRR